MSWARKSASDGSLGACSAANAAEVEETRRASQDGETQGKHPSGAEYASAVRAKHRADHAASLSEDRNSEHG
jgi:hypothetical protein